MTLKAFLRPSVHLYDDSGKHSSNRKIYEYGGSKLNGNIRSSCTQVGVENGPIRSMKTPSMQHQLRTRLLYGFIAYYL